MNMKNPAYRASLADHDPAETYDVVVQYPDRRRIVIVEDIAIEGAVMFAENFSAHYAEEPLEIDLIPNTPAYADVPRAVPCQRFHEDES